MKNVPKLLNLNSSSLNTCNNVHVTLGKKTHRTTHFVCSCLILNYILSKMIYTFPEQISCSIKIGQEYCDKGSYIHVLGNAMQVRWNVLQHIWEKKHRIKKFRYITELTIK